MTIIITNLNPTNMFQDVGIGLIALMVDITSQKSIEFCLLLSRMSI